MYNFKYLITILLMFSFYMTSGQNKFEVNQVFDTIITEAFTNSYTDSIEWQFSDDTIKMIRYYEGNILEEVNLPVIKKLGANIGKYKAIWVTLIGPIWIWEGNENIKPGVVIGMKPLSQNIHVPILAIIRWKSKN